MYDRAKSAVINVLLQLFETDTGVSTYREWIEYFVHFELSRPTPRRKVLPALDGQLSPKNRPSSVWQKPIIPFWEIKRERPEETMRITAGDADKEMIGQLIAITRLFDDETPHHRRAVIDETFQVFYLFTKSSIQADAIRSSRINKANFNAGKAHAHRRLIQEMAMHAYQEKFRRETGREPSVKEVAAGTGQSISTIYRRRKNFSDRRV